MTKDEALKLALEALEYIHEGANNQGPHTGISWRCVAVKAEPAITAIKQALAAPVQEPAFHGFMDTENCCVHICYTPWAPRMTDGKFATAYYTAQPAAQRQRVLFPTMLRKMWSGSEVQAWLDENVNKDKNT